MKGVGLIRRRRGRPEGRRDSHLLLRHATNGRRGGCLCNLTEQAKTIAEDKKIAVMTVDESGTERQPLPDER